MQCSRLCFSHTACDTNQDGKRTALEWLYMQRDVPLKVSHPLGTHPNLLRQNGCNAAGYVLAILPVTPIRMEKERRLIYIYIYNYRSTCKEADRVFTRPMKLVVLAISTTRVCVYMYR